MPCFSVKRISKALHFNFFSLCRARAHTLFHFICFLMAFYVKLLFVFHSNKINIFSSAHCIEMEASIFLPFPLALCCCWRVAITICAQYVRNVYISAKWSPHLSSNLLAEYHLNKEIKKRHPCGFRSASRLQAQWSLPPRSAHTHHTRIETVCQLADAQTYHTTVQSYKIDSGSPGAKAYGARIAWK